MPLSPGDQHGQVVALQALDLLRDALHGGAGADEAGQQRLERSLDLPRRRLDRALAGAAQSRIPAAAPRTASGTADGR